MTPSTGHLATYMQMDNGIYRVSCDRCSWSSQDVMTRNEAHDLAYTHTLRAAK